MRRQHAVEWRRNAALPAMCARPGATIADVCLHTQLRIEAASPRDRPLINMQLCREQFFDRFPYRLILDLNSMAGCPQ